jgi:hypothetical protein
MFCIVVVVVVSHGCYNLALVLLHCMGAIVWCWVLQLCIGVVVSHWVLLFCTLVQLLCGGGAPFHQCCTLVLLLHISIVFSHWCSLHVGVVSCIGFVTLHWCCHFTLVPWLCISVVVLCVGAMPLHWKSHFALVLLLRALVLLLGFFLLKPYCCYFLVGVALLSLVSLVSPPPSPCHVQVGAWSTRLLTDIEVIFFSFFGFFFGSFWYCFLFTF